MVLCTIGSDILSKELVSIIIPTYNGEEYILETIESCLNQSYDNIEVIVIDDGSTQDIEKRLKMYIESGQIKFIKQKNKGLPGARNAGISMAKGKYIQFLDDDDLISKDKIENQVKLLEKSEDVFGCYCKAEYFKKNKENKIFEFEIHPEEKFYKQLLNGNILTVNSALIRRTSEQFDESLKSLEDWDFWLSNALKDRIFKFDSDSVCFVRVHDKNMSKNVNRMLLNEIKVLKKNLGKSPYDEVIYFNIFKKLYYMKDQSYKKYIKLASGKNCKYRLLSYAYMINCTLKKCLGLNKSIYS